MPDSSPHKRLWFSPHGTSWTAESYEEALEMERDSLHEEYNRLVEQFGVEREALRLACRDLQDLHADFGDSRAQTYEPPDEDDVESLMEWLRAKVSNPASGSSDE